MKKFSQIGKTVSAFSLGLFCGVAYLISCGQTNTAVSGGGAIDATAITAETLVTTGTITSGGTITAPSITLPTGAGNGKFLRSNPAGEASWESPFRTSCPTGYTLIGTGGTVDTFCISTSYELPPGGPAKKWAIAQSNCTAKTPTANLCTINEWRRACGSSGVTEKDQMIWLLDVGAFLDNDNQLNFDGAWVSSEVGCEPEGVVNRSKYFITDPFEAFYRCCFR